MSYSISPKSVIKVLDYLDLLLLENGKEVIWRVTDPNDLAYKLRQALMTIEKKPSIFSKYSSLVKKYIFKVQPNKVIAKPIVPYSEVDASTKDRFIASVDKLVVNEVHDLNTLVGALLTNKQYNELYFPNVKLDDSDLTKAWKVSKSIGFKLIKGNGITLTKHECGELEWKPIE